MDENKHIATTLPVVRTAILVDGGFYKKEQIACGEKKNPQKGLMNYSSIV